MPSKSGGEKKKRQVHVNVTPDISGRLQSLERLSHYYSIKHSLPLETISRGCQGNRRASLCAWHSRAAPSWMFGMGFFRVTLGPDIQV